MSNISILVLGATGVSGLAFIEEALNSLHPPNLTLYVRTVSKLPSGVDKNERVRVVVGQLGDEDALAKAMEGVDTIVSFLGAYASLDAFIRRDRTTPIADSFPVIYKAMRSQGVRRILALSTPTYLLPSETKIGLQISIFNTVIPFIVPQGDAEMLAIAKSLAAQDDLDWTVFRVPGLTNASADLPVFAGYLGPEYKGSLRLSRASQARWLLKEINERAWIKKCPSLGNY